MTTLRIGEATINEIVEWSGIYRDPLEMFPDATQELVDLHRSWLEPHSIDPASGHLIMPFRSYLIRTGEHTILVDTCVGNDKERPLRPGWHRQNWPWMERFLSLGVTPEDVDLVVLTHLHTDHVGWNTRLEDGRWVPTFPNARYICHKQEYDYWDGEYLNQAWLKDSFEDSVLPVAEAGKLDLVAGDHEIDKGLWLEPVPGHTPGAVCLHLENGGEHGIFCADLMHHPLQVPEAQWSTIFCSDRERAHKTRSAFIDRYADTRTMFFPAHFANNGGGRIVSGGPDGKLMFDFAG